MVIETGKNSILTFNFKKNHMVREKVRTRFLLLKNHMIRQKVRNSILTF